MQPGDIVKRSWDKEESGVVTKVEVGCRLKHVLSGQEVEGWVSSDELEGALKVRISF
jgi:ubiquitin-conjugating enzyme E2 O